MDVAVGIRRPCGGAVGAVLRKFWLADGVWCRVPPPGPPRVPLLQGDGTTSIVLFTGELLKYADRFIGDGVHPRIIVEGFDIAKARTVEFLEKFKVERAEVYEDRERLLNVARTSLRSKLRVEVRGWSLCVFPRGWHGVPRARARDPCRRLRVSVRGECAVPRPPLPWPSPACITRPCVCVARSLPPSPHSWRTS